jgi:hypothetical protein
MAGTTYTPSQNVQDLIDSCFFNVPNADQMSRIQQIRSASKELIYLISTLCPNTSSDTLRSIQYLQMVLDASQKAILMGEKIN